MSTAFRIFVCVVMALFWGLLALGLCMIGVEIITRSTRATPLHAATPCAHAEPHKSGSRATQGERVGHARPAFNAEPTSSLQLIAYRFELTPSPRAHAADCNPSAGSRLWTGAAGSSWPLAKHCGALSAPTLPPADGLIFNGHAS